MAIVARKNKVYGEHIGLWSIRRNNQLFRLCIAEDESKANSNIKKNQDCVCWRKMVLLFDEIFNLDLDSTNTKQDRNN